MRALADAVCSVLRAQIVENVAGNEKLKAWQAKRKETAF
jgi:hypothetical protein